MTRASDIFLKITCQTIEKILLFRQDYYLNRIKGGIKLIINFLVLLYAEPFKVRTGKLQDPQTCCNFNFQTSQLAVGTDEESVKCLEQTGEITTRQQTIGIHAITGIERRNGLFFVHHVTYGQIFRTYLKGISDVNQVQESHLTCLVKMYNEIIEKSKQTSQKNYEAVISPIQQFALNHVQQPYSPEVKSFLGTKQVAVQQLIEGLQQDRTDEGIQKRRNYSEIKDWLLEQLKEKPAAQASHSVPKASPSGIPQELPTVPTGSRSRKEESRENSWTERGKALTSTYHLDFVNPSTKQSYLSERDKKAFFDLHHDTFVFRTDHFSDLDEKGKKEVLEQIAAFKRAWLGEDLITQDWFKEICAQNKIDLTDNQQVLRDMVTGNCGRFAHANAIQRSALFQYFTLPPDERKLRDPIAELLGAEPRMIKGILFH